MLCEGTFHGRKVRSNQRRGIARQFTRMKARVERLDRCELRAQSILSGPFTKIRTVESVGATFDTCAALDVVLRRPTISSTSKSVRVLLVTRIFILRPFLAVCGRQYPFPLHTSERGVLFVAKAVSDDEPTIRPSFPRARDSISNGSLRFKPFAFHYQPSKSSDVPFQREAVELRSSGLMPCIRETPIRVKTGSIGFHHDDVMRYASVIWRSSRSSCLNFSPPASILDVGVAAKHLTTFPARRVGNDTNEKPPVDSVITSNTRSSSPGLRASMIAATPGPVCQVFR